jgi:hypothetical protein
MAQTIIELQREDHAHLDRLLSRYAEESHFSRRDTFREIVQLVTTHAFAEEEVLFPAARRVLARTGEDITRDIEGEHQRINELLVELEPLRPGDPGFEARVEELFPLLRTDVRDEEDRLLARLQERMSPAQLERLGTAWKVAKRLAPSRGHPRIPRRPPGNVLAGIPLFFVDRLRDLVARLRHAPQ